jgi:hypothetical protein
MGITAPNTEATHTEIHADVPAKNKEKGKNIHFFDAKKAIEKTLIEGNTAKDATERYSPDKGKVNKNQSKIDELLEKRENVDTANISDVVIDEKLKFVEFTYKDTYHIKYEPQGFSDFITFYDSTKAITCSMEFNGSLFEKKNIENPKFNVVKIQNQYLAERLNMVVTMNDEMMKKIKAEGIEYDPEEEPVIVNKSTGFFIANQKMSKDNPKYKEGEENIEVGFFKVEYNKTEKKAICQ